MEAEYDHAIAAYASQVAYAKGDFRKLQAHRIVEAREEKKKAKVAYVDAGNEDEEGISIDDFEARVRARLAFQKVGEVLKTLENEGRFVNACPRVLCAWCCGFVPGLCSTYITPCPVHTPCPVPRTLVFVPILQARHR